MAGRVFVYTSSSDDPFLNLALEDGLFRGMGTEDRILFLWRSRPCVVIGRFQNPWVECSVEALERDGADLVRRQSGGGTVYHDGGNSNFSFLGPAGSFDADKNLGVVTAALDSLGIHAEISPRHDILVDGFKVSGSAFKKKRDRALHHGTLLIAADRERLSRYLAAPNLNIEAKGVSSVRSRVINLAELKPELNHNKFCEAVTEAFFRRAGAGDSARPDSSGGEAGASLERAELGASDLDDEGRAFRQNLESWEWRFGKTPPFAQRLAGFMRGRPVEVVLRVRDGLIEEVFPGTEEGTAGTEEAWGGLNSRLAGVRYGYEEIAAALERFRSVEGRAGTEESKMGTEDEARALGLWLLARLKGW